MEILRTEHRLKLCYTPLYNLDHSDLKICYLNARSLHKHIEDVTDVQKDINYSSTDILIFSETRFSPLDADEMYSIDGYRLFRNDMHFQLFWSYTSIWWNSYLQSNPINRWLIIGLYR